MIRVEGLAKKYRLGSWVGDQNLREVVVDSIKSVFGRGGKESVDSTLWALRDVSFEIGRGEVVGIIGRNGAGKSTLLKVLSRITDPSEGRAELFGRVGSLLEVGTGFHPELTGRENIFLNGAILGMSKGEIDRKFDEIVAFSEIERFLDTPVKRYSSGMYVRLAFAVAAHLEPEILLVDEVLAVGDAAFQRKCLGKMKDVAGHGRTVLFVSHNMGAVRALCERGIVFSGGQLHFDGPANDAVDEYLAQMEEASAQSLTHREDRGGEGNARFTSIEIRGTDGTPVSTLNTGQPMQLVFSYEGELAAPGCSFIVNDERGARLSLLSSEYSHSTDTVDPSMGRQLVCDIEALPLMPGEYNLDVQLLNRGVAEDIVDAATRFQVVGGESEGRLFKHESKWGAVTMRHRWSRPN